MTINSPARFTMWIGPVFCSRIPSMREGRSQGGEIPNAGGNWGHPPIDTSQDCVLSAFGLGGELGTPTDRHLTGLCSIGFWLENYQRQAN